MRKEHGGYERDRDGTLYEIMSDPETMRHYPAPFDADRTRRWIEWNLENYEKYGFGLWAVVLKETGGFIGDCGITLQEIDGETLPRSDTTSIKSTGGGATPKRRHGPRGTGSSGIRGTTPYGLI